jgi:hypothetical protein
MMLWCQPFIHSVGVFFQPECLISPNLSVREHDYCGQSPSPFSRPSSSFSVALSVSLPDLSEVTNHNYFLSFKT